MPGAKPPLTPKWAVVFSLAALAGALVLALGIRLIYGVSQATTLGFIAGCVVLFSWAALDRRSFRTCQRFVAAFTVVAAVVFVVLAVTQDDYEAFPLWGTVALAVAGLACCAVVGAYGMRNLIRWCRGELAQPLTSPEDVYLVSQNLEIATAAEVDRVEERLGCTFPPGYREYVTTLGLGTYTSLIRIDMPDKIVADLSDWRKRVQEYYFWYSGADVLAKQNVLQCVPLGDTLNGDELIFHPQKPGAVYVLPRNDERIYLAGASIYEAIDWLCGSGVLHDEVLSFRYFECWKDREKMEFAGRMGYREFKDSILSLDLHDHVACDSEGEGYLTLFYSSFYGCLSHSCPGAAEGPGESSVVLEYDKHMRSDVLLTLIAHVLSLGFREVPVDGQDADQVGTEHLQSRHT
jgi:hypothetical protein